MTTSGWFTAGGSLPCHPTPRPLVGSPDALSDADHLLAAFRAARGGLEMLALAAGAPDEALDALERDVEARLDAAEGDEAGALRERLQSLRFVRRDQAETIRQMRDLTRQVAEMPEAERQLLALVSIPNRLGIVALVVGNDDEALDALEGAAEARLAAPDEHEGVVRVRACLTDLREVRAEGREAAQAAIDAAQ